MRNFTLEYGDYVLIVIQFRNPGKNIVKVTEAIAQTLDGMCDTTSFQMKHGFFYCIGKYNGNST